MLLEIGELENELKKLYNFQQDQGQGPQPRLFCDGKLKVN